MRVQSRSDEGKSHPGEHDGKYGVSMPDTILTNKVTYFIVAVRPTARLLLYASGQAGVERLDSEEFANILSGVDLGLVLSVTVGVNT